MTKAERLFRILNLLKNSGDISISDMAQLLGVSNRTIYRDLKTIRRLGLSDSKSAFDSVEELEKELRGRRRISPISDLEFRLIKFALTTHPLVNIFPFKAISHRLENLLTKMSLAKKFVNPISNKKN